MTEPGHGLEFSRLRGHEAGGLELGLGEAAQALEVLHLERAEGEEGPALRTGTQETDNKHELWRGESGGESGIQGDGWIRVDSQTLTTKLNCRYCHPVERLKTVPQAMRQCFGKET